MSVIQDKALAVRKRLEPVDEEFSFDPAAFLLIVQIISQVFAAIVACKKEPDEVQAMAKRPGVVGRWHVRRAARRALADNETYRIIGPTLVQAVLDEGAKVTTEEAKAMFAEVGGGNGE